MINKIQALEQMRRILQMFAASLDDERAMEVATIYDPWIPGKSYKSGDLFTYGINGVGDPQLYRVNAGKDHTSQSDWTPDIEKSLYTAIGISNQGYAVWAQPTGAHDAYNIGDIVDYNGVIYISKIDGNCTIPGIDERWWGLHQE